MRYVRAPNRQLNGCSFVVFQLDDSLSGGLFVVCVLKCTRLGPAIPLPEYGLRNGSTTVAPEKMVAMQGHGRLRILLGAGRLTQMAFVMFTLVAGLAQAATPTAKRRGPDAGMFIGEREQGAMLGPSVTKQPCVKTLAAQLQCSPHYAPPLCAHASALTATHCCSTGPALELAGCHERGCARAGCGQPAPTA